MTHDIYDFTSGDYRATFRAAIDDLWRDGAHMDGTERSAAAERLVEAYIAQVPDWDSLGGRPEPIQLDRLATWVLKGADVTVDIKFLYVKSAEVVSVRKEGAA